MTDKELIQAYHACEQYKRCKDCPHDEGETCIVNVAGFDDLFARLEALIAENEHLRDLTKMVPQWHPESEPPGRKDRVWLNM